MIEYTVKAFSYGRKEWFLNGKRHREDGPAIEYSDGYGRRHSPARWYLNGKLVTEEEHRQRTQPQPTCDGKTVEIDGKTYVLTLKED